MNIFDINRHIKELRFARDKLNYEKNALFLKSKLSRKDFNRIDTIKYHLQCIDTKILDLKHTAKHIRLKRLKGIK